MRFKDTKTGKTRTNALDHDTVAALRRHRAKQNERRRARVRLHDLRHTSATILLRHGVASKVVSERLGHSTTALTTGTYQHVIAGMDEAAAAKAGEARREARARLAGT